MDYSKLKQILIDNYLYYLSLQKGKPISAKPSLQSKEGFDLFFTDERFEIDGLFEPKSPSFAKLYFHGIHFAKVKEYSAFPEEKHDTPYLTRMFRMSLQKYGMHERMMDYEIDKLFSSEKSLSEIYHVWLLFIPSKILDSRIANDEKLSPLEKGIEFSKLNSTPFYMPVFAIIRILRDNLKIYEDEIPLVYMKGYKGMEYKMK